MPLQQVWESGKLRPDQCMAYLVSVKKQSQPEAGSELPSDGKNSLGTNRSGGTAAFILRLYSLPFLAPYTSCVRGFFLFI